MEDKITALPNFFFSEQNYEEISSSSTAERNPPSHCGELQASSASHHSHQSTTKNTTPVSAAIAAWQRHHFLCSKIWAATLKAKDWVTSSQPVCSSSDLQRQLLSDWKLCCWCIIFQVHGCCCKGYWKHGILFPSTRRPLCKHATVAAVQVEDTCVEGLWFLPVVVAATSVFGARYTFSLWLYSLCFFSKHIPYVQGSFASS